MCKNAFQTYQLPSGNYTDIISDIADLFNFFCFFVASDIDKIHYNICRHNNKV